MRIESLVPGVVLDVPGTLARFGGDQQLFLEMTNMLLEDAPVLFGQLQTAVAKRDTSDVQMKAHALKGVLSGCGGVRASQVAQLLEDGGRTGQLQDAPAQIESLEGELASLTKAIHAYRA